MFSPTACLQSFFTLCLVLSFCGHALATAPEAEEEPESPDPEGENYETVVVSPTTELADRVPRRHWSTAADGPSAALASSVTELAAQLGSLAIQETHRGSGSPILRGLIGPQNAIMLDDIPINMASFRTGPNQYFRLLPLSALESLSLYEGPGSVVSGSGAMGGVVHATTLDARDQPKVSAQLGANSADASQHGMLIASSRHATHPVVMGAQRTRHDILHSSGRTPWPASDFTEFNGFLKADLTLTPTQRLIAFASFSGIDDAGRTDRLGQGDIRWYDNSMMVTYLRWLYEPAKSWVRTARVTPHVQYLQEGIDRYTCLGNTSVEGLARTECAERNYDWITRHRNYSDTIRAIGLTTDVTTRPLLGWLSLSFGADLRLEHVTSLLEDSKVQEMDSPIEPRGQLSNGSQYGTGALWVLSKTDLHQSDEGGRLRLHAGARATASGAIARRVPGIGDVNYDAFGVVGSTGLRWNHRSGFGAFVSLDQGFRAPNLQETTVLGDTGSKFEVPNAELLPEYSNAAEVGLSYRGSSVHTTVSGHATWLDGLIDEQSATWEGQSEVDGKPVVMRVNANGGFYWGASLESLWHHGAWSSSLRASYTFGEVDRGDEVVAGRRVPPPMGAITFAYAISDELWVDTRVHGAGSQTRLHPSDQQDLRICETLQFSGELDENCAGSPAWGAADIRAGWSMSESMELIVKLQNLGDTQYRVHGSGTDQPGRSIWATVRYRMPK